MSSVKVMPSRTKQKKKGIGEDALHLGPRKTGLKQFCLMFRFHRGICSHRYTTRTPQPYFFKT